MAEELELELELDTKVREFIKEAVPDWEEPEKARARFKALSGQRSDWEPQFGFWRDLILNISRRFNLFFLPPSHHIKLRWFARAALTPLCLDNVLLEMYRSGDLLRMSDLQDPKSPHISLLLKKIIRFSTAFLSSTATHILSERLILLPRLQEKAGQVVESFSQSHWTSSCIVTMKTYQTLFLDQHEAYAVLSYLSAHGRAKYISIKNKQLVEGVKFSLSSATITITPNVDYDMLQLIWTAEELQQQLDMIDKQYERSRQFALAALRSGDKNIALRNARQLKLASESRAKLLSYLNRVEGILHVISDAKSTMMVLEAVQVGARAINEHKIEAEEVQSCLRMLDELMISQVEVNKALESHTENDVDIEEELHELELQIRDETVKVSTVTAKGNAEEGLAFTNSLSTAMADLKLGPPKTSLSRVENELPS